MKQQFVSILTVLLAVIMFSNCSGDVENLHESKKRIAKYYESGKYEQELEQALKPAYGKLEKRFDGKAAIVFDVDETILSNYRYIKSLDFGFQSNLWNNYLDEASAEPIKQTVDLYRQAVSSNLSVIFLTARTGKSYEETFNNLVKFGIDKFDTLICKDEKYNSISSRVFKETERKMLTDLGYEIVMCVGDQESDLAGDFTGEKIKLPNKMYRTH